MALYEYECETCGNIDTLFVLSEDRDNPPQKCPVCGEREYRRFFATPSIKIKNPVVQTGNSSDAVIKERRNVE
jgi:putative FmdB family regulatory protein